MLYCRPHADKMALCIKKNCFTMSIGQRVESVVNKQCLVWHFHTIFLLSQEDISGAVLCLATVVSYNHLNNVYNLSLQSYIHCNGLVTLLSWFSFNLFLYLYFSIVVDFCG